MEKTRLALVFILILALFLRFLYFPDNIYFGYDQARDAFAAREILNGDLKIVGPSTSEEGLYHGAIYYYLIAPFYFLGDGNPEVPSAAFRILNALGVIVIFWIGYILFGRLVGIISALFYTFSFEQTQFAIYLSNPAGASVTIPLMFLGLALLMFRKKYIGLPMSFLGLGLSIQFEFALLYLVIPFLIILTINFKVLMNLPIKHWILSIIAFLLSGSTFILAEIKYDYRTIQTLLHYVNPESKQTLFDKFSSYLTTLNKMGEFNLYDNFQYGYLIWFFLLGTATYLLFKRELRKKIVFLLIWFFSLLIVYLIKGGYSDLYYTNIGISVSLLIFVALLVTFLIKKNLLIGLIIITALIVSNLKMITMLNPRGTISQIHVQQGMLLSDQKEILDKIYQDASSQPFAVKALTMPYDVNTTWSYLFEWFGNKKYGYLPYWNGQTADGYPGNLQVFQIHEKLPEKRYVIIEPIRGVPEHLINQFLREESYFTNIEDEEKIGKFVLQLRKKK